MISYYEEDYFYYLFFALLISYSFLILNIYFLYFSTLYFSTYFLMRHSLQKKESYGICSSGGSKQYT